MQKEKSIGRNILIIFLIIVMIASVCAGLFAWAKYQTTINGTATGETAKWSFKVSDGNTSTQEIEFPMTRTDNNTSVAEGIIAPGTFGEIEIGIDATGTETALTYTIEGELTNLPTNMKFYSDAERTLDLTIIENKFTKGGYMKLNEIGEITEKIYWEWPFETTTYPVITEEKLVSLGIDKNKFDAVISANKFTEANDMLDIAENSKQVSMIISVTGKQLNGNPVLADLVQIGDYINYSAVNTVDGQSYSYTTKESLTGSSTISTFNSSDPMKWRVLNIDKKNGKIDLIAITENRVEFSKGIGFVNAEDVLDNIANVYGYGKGAIESRSINVEDINELTGYNPKEASDRFLQEYSMKSGNFYKQQIGTDGDVIGYEKELTTASTSSPITMKFTNYSYIGEKYLQGVLYNLIFKSDDGDEYKSAEEQGYTKLWLASRSVYANSTSCSYALRGISKGNVSGLDMYHSTSGDKTGGARWVGVIVSINCNLKTTGQDSNGVWQLDV
ncbi:MAG: hypothetical protein E7313_00675 [Clostridiales bacterium]|nr:hypothetical protein [Clostridiales bacterium]